MVQLDLKVKLEPPEHEASADLLDQKVPAVPQVRGALLGLWGRSGSLALLAPELLAQLVQRAPHQLHEKQTTRQLLKYLPATRTAKATIRGLNYTLLRAQQDRADKTAQLDREAFSARRARQARSALLARLELLVQLVYRALPALPA